MDRDTALMFVVISLAIVLVLFLACVIYASVVNHGLPDWGGFAWTGKTLLNCCE